MKSCLRKLDLFSAQYQATDRVIPYLGFANATSLEAFSIVWRAPTLPERDLLRRWAALLRGALRRRRWSYPSRALLCSIPMCCRALRRWAHGQSADRPSEGNLRELGPENQRQPLAVVVDER